MRVGFGWGHLKKETMSKSQESFWLRDPVSILKEANMTFCWHSYVGTNEYPE